MDISGLRITRVRQVRPGTLFYHLSAGKNVVCLSAIRLGGSDGEELVVPLCFDAEPESVGRAMYAANFDGFAAILTDVEAVPDYSTASEAPKGAIFTDGENLLYPLVGSRGFSEFVDVVSGVIDPKAYPRIAFESWSVVDVTDRDRKIYSSGG